jgi:hypothetical protein
MTEIEHLKGQIVVLSIFASKLEVYPVVNEKRKYLIWNIIKKKSDANILAELVQFLSQSELKINTIN